MAKGAVVVGDVTLGDHSSVWYNAVLRGDINLSGSETSPTFRIMRSFTWPTSSPALWATTSPSATPPSFMPAR